LIGRRTGGSLPRSHIEKLAQFFFFTKTQAAQVSCPYLKKGTEAQR
jgi:hypothetical protein